MNSSLRNIMRSFVFSVGLIAVCTSCNKDLPEAEPIVPPKPSGQSIAALVNADPELTILKAAIARAGATMTATLSDSTGVFTLYAPTDAALQAAGIPSAAAIGFLRPGMVDTLLRYHIVGGQVLTSSAVPASFPNLQEPSLLVLAPPSASLPPGLRMPLFPSKSNSMLWVNNIPVVQPDIVASNGVVHKVAAVVAPPTQFLWERISADPDLTYLKAAIERADVGSEPSSSLQAALLNPAASITVFAPGNVAFQQLLTAQITQALMAQGMDQATANGTAIALASTPAVFSNPALDAVLTPQVVKGLIAYHVLGKRAFSVNLPGAGMNVPTLLNTAVPNHPGITLQATFGPTGVTVASVKGAANQSAAAVAINPTPAPNGTSDQLYINGILHKINQVLLPQ